MTAQSAKQNIDIAVTGYACRLPKAPDPDAFWRVLMDRECVIGEIEPDRWSKEMFLHRDKGALGKSYTFAAGQVDGVWDFDPAFFSISPREAAQMDPQQRILLQTVWRAVEHAGLRPADLSKGKTGVYIGAASSDHSWRFLADLAAIDSPFMTGNTLSIVSNRISYLLDLKGPSFTVDTACSSSFYAMHQAVQALRAGEVDTAIVGGVNLLLSPAAFVGFSRATMLSPEGLCKAFDSGADGYVRSEGAVVFILRRLDLAQENGDAIRSIVVGSGVNSDGRTVGMAMPSPERQADLLRQMLRELQFDPDDLAFLEAHGTGTPVGDPMEANAIGEVFGRRRASPLAIGSAKTNFGHLEPASGLVGLLKAQMALEKGVYPASLHFNEPNPNIPFDDLNLDVASAHLELPARDTPWMAGVNSFGFGGANAHVLLRQPYQTETTPAAPAPAPRALAISAASEESLRALSASWRAALAEADAPTVAAMVNAAAHRRERLGHRLVALGETAEGLSAALAAYEAGEKDPRYVAGQKIGRGAKTAFVFSGNGSQWAGMGLDLYEGDETFRTAFDRVSALFKKESAGEIDLAELLESEDLGEALAESRIAQPILFAVQVALVESLAAEGLRPDAVAGHSVGEVAAAWCAGVLTLEDAVHLIRTRSVALEVMRGTGGMAAVLAGVEAAEAALAEFGEQGITVAADNSPRSSTIAGPVEALKAFSKFARKRRVAAKLLDIDYPYHSPGIDPIRAKLIADLSDLRPRPGHAAYVSATSGREAPGVALDTEYWWRNARQPVQFREAVDALAQLGCGVFVEIGPRPVLQNYVTDTLGDRGYGASYMPTLEQTSRHEPSAAALAARALTLGAQIDNGPLFGPRTPYRGGLPDYPWRNTPFRAEVTPEAIDIYGQKGTLPLLGARLREGEGAWHNLLDARLQTWLADHVVDGAAVFPAAGYVEMALAAGSATHGAVELSEFEILRPLLLPDDEAVETRVRLDAATGGVRIESRRRLSASDWTLNAFGVIRAAPGPAPEAERPAAKGMTKVAAKTLYRTLAGFGLEYGPAFQRVTALKVGADAAEATLAPAETDGAFSLAPTAFDAAMHAILPLIGRQGDGKAPEGVAFLPVRVGDVRLHRPNAAAAAARVRLVKFSPRGAEAEIDMLDAEGGLIAAAKGVRLKAVTFARARRPEDQLWRQRLVRLAGPDRRAAAPAAWRAPLKRLRALGLAGDAAPEPDVGALLADAVGRRLAWDAAARFAAPDRTVDIASAIDLAPDARPLLARALIALEEDGVFEAGEMGSGALAEVCPYPTLDELFAALSEEAPERSTDLLALLDLADELPGRLTEGLSDQPRPRQVVNLSPADRAVWRAVEKIFDDVAAGWSADAPLSVLVVGAPASGAMARMAAHPALSTLTVTDPSDAVVEGLKQVARPAPRLRIRPMDEALAPSAHDLVICGDSLWRLGRDRLRATLDALAGRGVFAAVEGRPDLLTDLREGVAAEWWAETLSPEAPIGRRLPPEDWLAEMEDAGMTAMGAAALMDPAAEASVICGRAPDRQARVRDADENAPELVILHDGARRTEAAAREIEAALSAIGRAARTSAASEIPGDLPEAWEAVFLPGLFADGAEDLERAQARLAVVHGMLAAARPARLWLVTRGGRPAADGAGGARRPAEAAVWGLGRVLANEPGGPEIRLIDFDPKLAGEDLVEALAGELSAPGEERELVFDAHGKAAPRVESAADLADAAALSAIGEDAARRLEILHQGSFDSLAWRPVARRAPAETEVEIEVRATGLNFRDVMWAQGLLPEEALEDGFAGATLGMECAGVVTRAGAGADFAPGDPVIAFGPACFASHVTIDARAVAPLPGGTDFDTAAAAPTIFITAQYGLIELANLRPGETVLIHGGAGGVGLAAIQVARRAGARVFATAGTRAKRRLLKALGVERVFDSRSLGFADAVLEATGGAGVDVVLNSLSGEAMERSVACLRPFGRFVELGKRDYYANTMIGLRPFRRNLSYFGVDADQLLAARPDVADRLFADLAAGFAAGEFAPPPCQIFEADEIVDAFRLMQKSGHIGKIVVRPPAAPAAAPAPAPAIGEGAWLIVGGLGGFGLKTAEWLAAKGVRKLWLTSRSGEADRDGRAAVAALRKAGVTVETVASDATRPEDVAALFEAIDADETPLKGVVHSAMVLDDGLFEGLDAARIEKVLAPKIAGAGNLDAATRGRGLDHFILFSSVTTLFGNPGQAPYVAANAYLESLAASRRAEGEAGLAVAWGPIGDSGYLAREEDTRELLEKRLGGAMLTGEAALAGLDMTLAAGAPDAAISIAPIRWGKLAGDLPLLQTPLFERIERARDAAGGGEGEIDVLALIEGLSDAEALKAIIDLLAVETGRILRQPPGELDPRRPLTEMGFDSLMAVDLKMAVEERVGATLPLMSLSEGVGLSDLARKLLDEVRGAAAPALDANEAVGELVAQHVKDDLDKLDRDIFDKVAKQAEKLKSK